jgi:carboxypeptidase Q
MEFYGGPLLGRPGLVLFKMITPQLPEEEPAMRRLRPHYTLLALALLSICIPLSAQQTPTPSPGDMVERIKDEGTNRSQVMQTLSYLTDVIGPRLTGSPGLKRANEWTRDRMKEWGLENAHLEKWGPFGRGWSLQRFSAQVTEPQNIPLIAYPKAWSPGLRGTLTAPVVYVDATDEAGLQKYKGKLKGAIVLTTAPRTVRAHFEAQGTRWTDQQLADMEARTSAAGGRQGGRPQGRPGGTGPGQDFRTLAQFQSTKAKFFQDEGVALLVDPSSRGDGGTMFVQSATVPQATPPAARGTTSGTTAGTPGTPNASGDAAGATAPAGGRGQAPGRARLSPWDKSAPKMIPQIVMTSEHYNRLVRMLQQGENLKMAVELAVKFHDDDPYAYNTVAEIPGADLKDQVVMLGGHLDSWHSGTGATDNAAGCAVAMEAVRILKALGVQPRRTIRVGLWSGEEQGLYGSRAYVAEHFGAYKPTSAGGGTPSPGSGAPGGRGVLEKKPEYEKLSGYFNLDNGTGKIRGIYAQGNEAIKPIFKEWLAPFKEMGATTVTISNTGGTDHQSFDGIGLPGFQFIQDEVEYETRTHHSNQDVYDRAQADDLKQAAIIMATFVYNTAMRDEMLPRKPLPAAP